MLKKITSMRDIQKNDIIVDDPDIEKGKQYRIENISNGNVYAIHADGVLDLKIINDYDLSIGNWWKKMNN